MSTGKRSRGQPLLANCKVYMFEQAAASYASRPGRQASIAAVKICELGLVLNGIAENIRLWKPCVDFKMDAATEDYDEDDYAAHFKDKINQGDHRLFRLEQAILEASPIDQKGSSLFLLSPRALIGGDINHNDDDILARAFYFRPSICHRIVFAGVATRDSALSFLAACQESSFDWSPISKAYAKWRVQEGC